MTENEIASQILDTAFAVHTRLGPGLLETVYETVLEAELQKKGLKVERPKKMPVAWGELVIDPGFRADLVVDDKVIVEVKSVEELGPVHKKQLLTYLRLSDRRLGLLINFYTARLKDGIVRIVNNLPE